MASLEVLPASAFIETTGSSLADEGVPRVKEHIKTVLNAGGGAIFVDEAYQLTPSSEQFSSKGKQVLDYLLAEMENNVGKIVFIFAGYAKQMEKFFAHNPGLNSRIPYQLKFTDYEDGELLCILQQVIDKIYKGNMKIEDGPHGLFMRIVIRRIGRGRGREGFGNARAVHNIFAKIRGRQAKRVAGQRRARQNPDHHFLTKEDLIGPEPSKAMENSVAWKELQSLVGLAAVKESIKALFDLIIENYHRELIEKEPIQMSLNKVFTGSPGTGKTSVGKLYGAVLSDMGLLSNGEGDTC